MKTLRLWGIFPLFVLVSALFASEPEYQLPIGRNCDKQSTAVLIAIVGNTPRPGQFLQYAPQIGPLEEVIKSRIHSMALTFIPVVGEEELDHWIIVRSEIGLFQGGEFKLRKTSSGWVIPTEILERQFIRSTSREWPLSGVTGVSMSLYFGGDRVKYYSTKEGLGGDSSCDIVSAQSLLEMGTASINGAYAYPWLKESWWDSGTVTIEGFDGKGGKGSATFDVLDGHFIEASTPPPVFLSQLVKPVVTPRIVGTTQTSDGAFKVTVYGDSIPVAVETTSNLGPGGEWTGVYPPFYPTREKFLETFPDGSQGVIFHPPAGSTGNFFRLRSLVPDQTKALPKK